MGSMTRRQNWTFLTNHARVLVTIARDPAARLRDVAQVCALTERTVQAIVADLESDGYLRRARDGRRNRYEISPGAMFRHPAEAGVAVAGLLALLTGAPPSGEAGEEDADTEGADATAAYAPDPVAATAGETYTAGPQPTHPHSSPAGV
ncbi:MarR family transcriptional regulator [Streptomyces sp. W1SF4]|nr:MarR family transcriptional regulator [Streptomyces sp. W1SF4]